MEFNLTVQEKTDLNIVEIKDLSSDESLEFGLGKIKRLRIVFKNKYELSIIKGKGTYGNEQGLFEIAPFNPKGVLDGSILGLSDDVEGYLNKKEVLERVKIISRLKEEK
jgi:hypothetical protein